MKKITLINFFKYLKIKKKKNPRHIIFYISLLKTQHNLLCALFNNNDYNS